MIIEYFLKRINDLIVQSEQSAVLGTCIGIGAFFSAVGGKLAQLFIDKTEIFIGVTILLSFILLPLSLFLGHRLWDIIRKWQPSFEENLAIIDKLREDTAKTIEMLKNSNNSEETSHLIQEVSEAFLKHRKNIYIQAKLNMDFANEFLLIEKLLKRIDDKQKFQLQAGQKSELKAKSPAKVEDDDEELELSVNLEDDKQRELCT